MKLDALIALTQASYEIVLYKYVSLLDIIKTNKRIRIVKTHLLF